MEEEKEEWDGPWKEALECLDLAFGLFWPDVPGEVALGKGWAPLEQELQKLTPDRATGATVRSMGDRGALLARRPWRAREGPPLLPPCWPTRALARPQRQQGSAGQAGEARCRRRGGGAPRPLLRLRLGVGLAYSEYGGALRGLQPP